MTDTTKAAEAAAADMFPGSSWTQEQRGEMWSRVVAAEQAEQTKQAETEKVGQCMSCGAIEAILHGNTWTKDFSSIGESEVYPVGNRCEFCD